MRKRQYTPVRQVVYKIISTDEQVTVLENAALKTIDGIDFVPIVDKKGHTKLMRKDCLVKCSSHEVLHG